MLTELHIQNFAIIDKLDLRFDSGLIILTGETGAGKSIILDAVVMLIGGKADTTFVRTDSGKRGGALHPQPRRING
jgi:DNA repair protein RecN (Recombination protein N)